LTDRESWYKARRRKKIGKVVFLLLSCLVLLPLAIYTTVNLAVENDYYWRHHVWTEAEKMGENPYEEPPVPAFFFWGGWAAIILWILFSISALVLIGTLQKPEGVP
jgi:hypothetical protein